jgi:Uncharacterised protein conserved in bacteria (DUF2326)
VVYACDEDLQVQRTLSLAEYTAVLKRAYRLELPDLSFRELVGLYLRVWGKDNLTVDRPLHAIQTQPAKECVDTLISVFGKYETIRDCAKKVASHEEEIRTLAAAKRHEIVPSVTKREYVDNQKRIETLQNQLTDIRDHLAKYATSLSAVVNREVLDLKFQKDGLLGLRLTLADRLQRTQRNLQSNRALRSKSFQELTKFFPDVNQERLEKVEEFHNGVAKLLRAELKAARSQLEEQLGQVDTTVADIDQRMAGALSSVDKPEGLVDRVVDTALALRSTQDANVRYESEAALHLSLDNLRQQLATEKEKVLEHIQAVANDGMRRIVTDVFGENRKSPRLTLRDKSYSFDVYDDTGTGTAYVGLVVFDLTIFLATQLPVVAHDSLLFKNIENDSVARLIQVYRKTDKQSFIALDEIAKYGAATAEVLRQRSVIKLDDGHVLYVKDWRKRH